MFDFNIDVQQQATAVSYFTFICLYLFCVLKYKHLMRPIATVYENQLEWKNNIPLFVGLFILVIAAITRGDFYHYCDVVQNYTKGQYVNFEELYEWLIIVVNNNYLLWRIVIWGGGLIVFWVVVKRLEINVVYAFFILFVFYVNLYNYARASIAFVVYVFGVSFLLKPYKNVIISFPIGIALIWYSHYFHSTSYLLMALTPIIFLPINKRTIWLLIVAMPLIAKLSFSLFLNSGDIAMSLGNDMLSEKLNNYNTNVDIAFRGGLSGFFYHFLQYSSMLVPLVVILFTMLRNAENFDYPFAIRGLMKIALSISILSICLLIVTDLPVYFYRTLNMLIVFIPLLFAYLHQNGLLKPRLEKLCFGVCIGSIMFEATYGLYLKLL